MLILNLIHQPTTPISSLGIPLASFFNVQGSMVMDVSYIHYLQTLSYVSYVISFTKKKKKKDNGLSIEMGLLCTLTNDAKGKPTAL